MLDIDFFRNIYSNILSERNIMLNLTEINNLYKSGKYIGSLKEFYIKYPDFDYKFYLNFYDLNFEHHDDPEIFAIITYLRNSELNIKNQSDAINNLVNIEHKKISKYEIKDKKILMITHNSSLTGAPIVISELCYLYGSQNTIDVISITLKIIMELENYVFIKIVI